MGRFRIFRSRFCVHMFAGVLSLALASCHGGSNTLVPGALPHASTGAGPMSRMAPPMSLTKPKSMSPGRIAPPPMLKSAVLPPTAMMSVESVSPMQRVVGTDWTQVQGTAAEVDASPDGSLWALSPGSSADKSIWHYAGGSWTNIPGAAMHLAVGPKGGLYAVNAAGGIYSWTSGAWTAVAGGASAITVASDGSLYVLSNAGSGDQAVWHDVNGTWTQLPGSGVVITSSWETQNHTTPGGTVYPGGFYLLNSAGNIYYGMPSGTYVPFPGTASRITVTMTGGFYVLSNTPVANDYPLFYYNLDAPGWTAENGSGVSISASTDVNMNLYIANSSNAIYSSPILSLAPTIGTVAEYDLLTPNSEPSGITSGPDGFLWVAELNAGKIARVSRDGYVAEFVAAPPQGGYAAPYPNRITTGPDRNLWVTMQGAIGRMTTGGYFTEFLLPANSTGTGGIAAGPDGNLWFTETSSGKIGKISTAGFVTEYPIPTVYSNPTGRKFSV